MTWDTPYKSKPPLYGFIKKDGDNTNSVYFGQKQINAPAKAIIAAIIIVLLALTYAFVLFSIPASVIYSPDEPVAHIGPSLTPTESGSAPVTGVMRPDAGEQVAQGHALILFSIPASVFYDPDEPVAQIESDLAPTASDSAPLTEVMPPGAGEQVTPGIIEQITDMSPAIRLIESPLMIEQARGRGLSPSRLQR
jgi:hypothetical protein